MLIHVVARGDTLWEISRRYSVTIESIVAANGITNPDVLVVGAGPGDPGARCAWAAPCARPLHRAAGRHPFS